MKKERIDFFSSPNPTSHHFNLHNSLQQKFHQFSQVMAEEISFNTPARLSQTNKKAPKINIDPYLYFSDTIKKKQKHSMDQQFDEQSQDDCQELSQDFNEYEAIREKIQFSQEEEEQLLVQITPKKIHNFDTNNPEAIDNQMTSKKKAIMLSTPISEGKIYEKGLKKLAKDAYLFVCSQKRTTYKEVARKLIHNLNDDRQQEYHVNVALSQKRGEMNIKRRVYDALNVLIALGLLKRNGNKIMCKDLQSQMKNKRHISFQKRQQFLQNQYQYYKKELQKKSLSLNHKKTMMNKIQRKFERIKDLYDRNFKQKVMDLSQVIHLPLLMMFLEENKKNKNEKYEIEESVIICQEQQQGLKCIFNNHLNNKINIYGDVDLIQQMLPSAPIIFEKPIKCEQNFDQVQKVNKIRRVRR